MIRDEKVMPAFAAIQEIAIIARWRIGKNEDHQDIYGLLDGAEYLAGLACRGDDQTDAFESYLEMICEKHSCSQAIRIFREGK